MREKILAYLHDHPGARKREIAGHLHIWQCNSDFLLLMGLMADTGQIRYETYRDPAQMEYYDKWYAVGE